MIEEKKFYGLRNDYMFHAVFQESKEALRGIVSALMGMNQEDIVSCTVENPIELGKNIDDKTVILDIKLLLNSGEQINIEMQARKEAFWCERSLFYWSRTFNQLEKGQTYGELKRTIHIGILDFPLFDNDQDFYSEYLIMNAKTHKVYTDKFSIRILDLTKIPQVDEETYGELLRWARIFKAETMEELEQICEEKEEYQDMVVTMKKLTEDEKIRMQCEAREMYEHDMASEYESGFESGKKEGDKEGYDRGDKEGYNRCQKDTVFNLYSLGDDINKISKVTNVAVEEIMKLLGIQPV